MRPPAIASRCSQWQVFSWAFYLLLSYWQRAVGIANLGRAGAVSYLLMLSSTPTTVFTNAAGTLLAHPAGYAIVRYASGTLQIPDLAALLARLGELLLSHGWYKILLDLQALPVLSEAVKEWTRDNWQQPGVPRPSRLAQATLLPANVFSRLAVAQLQLGADDAIEHRNFPDQAAAHAWLLSLPAAAPSR